MPKKLTNFYDKKFLITQISLSRFGGSEIATLELAEFLINKGAKVSVYTYYAGSPMIDFFSEKNVKVFTDESEISGDDFNYVWVHHQIIPNFIIDKLGKENCPVFIFNHMSPHDFVPIESPYIWQIENNISSLSVFNSKETLMIQSEFLREDLPKELYNNPSPISFSDYRCTKNMEGVTCRKVLIVSNHPPQELIDMKDTLNKSGKIKVVSLGDDQDKSTLVTAELLSEYDVVVTIGKTVQYCLVAGIPVYIYDKFGGCGFLDEENFKIAEENNFSGRGFLSKDAEEICNDLSRGYGEAFIFQRDHRQKFIEKFSIEYVFESVMKKLKNHKIVVPSADYIKYIKVNNLIISTYVKDLQRSMKDIKNLWDAIESKDAEIVHNIGEIKSLKDSISKQKEEILSLENTWWRKILRGLKRTYGKIVK